MIYATVHLTINAPDSFAAYAQEAGPALKKWGASPVAMSTEIEKLEGDSPAPGRVVILSFPDLEAARGWKNDPELQHIHDLRMGSGICDIYLLA